MTVDAKFVRDTQAQLRRSAELLWQGGKRIKVDHVTISASTCYGCEVERIVGQMLERDLGQFWSSYTSPEDRALFLLMVAESL